MNRKIDWLNQMIVTRLKWKVNSLTTKISMVFQTGMKVGKEWSLKIRLSSNFVKN